MTWRAVLREAGYLTGGLLHVPTSGTTGAGPRVVVRSVSSWVDSFGPFTALTGITARDQVLVAGPSSSSMLVYARAHAAWLGATLLGGDRWDPRLADEATVAQVTPTMLADLLDRPAGALRLAVVAGAALAPGLRAAASERGVEVIEYYGAAELSFVAIGREVLRPFPQVEVEARDGVLWVSSPWVARGYLGGVEGPLRRAGEWCTVGDRGRVDGGVVTVTGRDGLALTGGVSVVLAEVEAALRTAPGVRDCVVLGVPNTRLGEVVVAVVVAEERGPVVAHARTLLPRAAVPVRWYALDALPRTPAGKADVGALHAALASRRLAVWR